MATQSQRKPRISRAANEMALALKGIDGITPEDLAARRNLVFGKVAKDAIPATGSRVQVSDLLSGTPFHGVRGSVHADSALPVSGAPFAARCVMVRFDSAIIANRCHYPVPVACLVAEAATA